MSAATFTPVTRPSGPRPSGPRPATHSTHSTHSAHRVGNALRAVRVFAGAAFGVAVLGEYAQEAGVRRR
ncbi:hypothetical protein [Streptomyces sp. NPDC047928]|uniref:hypothetical protein n=1 Tax=unclassified Streptomyces TaxID=2593676 RepID=UPI003710112E